MLDASHGARGALTNNDKRLGMSVRQGNQAVTRQTSSTTSPWQRSALALIAAAPLPAIPHISPAEAQKALPGLDLWDIWPVQLADGTPAPLHCDGPAPLVGGTLWMVLSAPVLPDPNQRHDIARIRLLLCDEQGWHDCGDMFPDGFTPGAREWSGSALYDPASGRVTCHFTATGHRGAADGSFEQRLFVSHGLLDLSGPRPRITGWSVPVQSVRSDGALYVDTAVEQGRPGLIRGFRDPCWFIDPADGREWLLFTGSLGGSASEYSGVIGLAEAQADGSGYTLLPPLISGDGMVNELERPHMIVHAGLYYLFWSSGAPIFAPDAPAPTGLYGMVGPSVTGPFEPLNGSGLVLCNPADEPRQSYCWQVLPSLDVTSFVDLHGLNGRDPASEPGLARAQFGGTMAPMLKIVLDGTTARLLGRA